MLFTRELSHGRNFKLVLVTVLLFVLVWGFKYSTARAAINEQIAFYGTLQDGSGNTLDGTYDMVFRFYDAPVGGTLLDTSTHTSGNGNAVTVDGGRFAVDLGSGIGNELDGIDFNSESIYIGLTIGSDSEMTPRERLTAAAYAFNSDTLDGLDSTDFVQANGTATIEATSSGSLLSLIQNGVGAVLDVFSGATNLFTVQSNGNVGVGTSTPYAQLSVAGNLALAGGLFDSTATMGQNGQVLLSTGSGVTWVATSTLGLGGSGATVSSVGLSAPIGFTVSGSPVTSAGTLSFSYAPGYEGLLSASSTNWNSFYNTPSSRITAGTGLSWTGSTLSAEVSSATLSNYLPLLGGTLTGNLTMSGSAANIALGNNFLSGDGGDEGLFVNSIGNVGIGTTTPRRSLTLFNSANDSAVMSLEVPGLLGDQASQIDLVTRSDGGFLGASANNKGWQISARGDSFNTPSQRNDLLFYHWSGAAFTPAFVIDSALGNIGIGEETPIQKLHVRGTNSQGLFWESATEFVRVGVGEATSTAVIGWDDTDSLELGVYDSPTDTSITSRMTILANGNVGIGTTTPSQLLTVAGNARITGALFDNNNSAGSNGMVLQSTGSGFAWTATSTLGFGSAFSNSAQLAALLSDETGTGNVVFSDSPTFTGTVNGAAVALSSTLSMNGSAANIALGNNFLSGDGGDEGITVDSNGGVAINTVSGSVSSALDLINSSGSVGAGNRFSFQTSSVRQVELYQQLMSAGNSDFYITVRGANTLTERFRITSAGNVGIGTTTPGARLDLDTGGLRVFGDIQTDAQSDSLTFLGVGAGQNNTVTGIGVEGTGNTAIGFRSLFDNTTGNQNTAVGFASLRFNTTGVNNTANGFYALFANSTGNFNTANGFFALAANTTGQHNTAVGLDALRFNTSGESNVGVGASALSANTGGIQNTAIGRLAGADIIGSSNTFVGYNTGRGITSGANNTILGANVTGLPSSLSNNIIIADGAGNRRINVDASGNVGIGTSTPSQLLTVAGNTRITGALFDNNNSAGSNGMVLQSTGSGFTWTATSTLGFASAFSNSAQLAALLSDETGSGGGFVRATSPVFNTNIDIGSAGVRLSGDNGALTFLGLGGGTDEALTLNLNDFNRAQLTSSTGVGALEFNELGVYIQNSNLSISLDDPTASAGSAPLGQSIFVAKAEATGSVFITGQNIQANLYNTNTLEDTYVTGSFISTAFTDSTLTWGQRIVAESLRGTVYGIDITTEDNEGAGDLNRATLTYGQRINAQSATGTVYGLYVTTENHLGDTNYAAIFNGGNVGIGTTTPSQLLTVAGNTRITGALFDSTNSAGSNGMVLQSTGSGLAWTATSTLGFASAFSNSAQLAAILSDETGTGNVVFSDSPTFSGTVNTAALTTSGNFTLSGTAANIALGSNFLSGDGGDEGIFIDGSGNVGIGTNNPQVPLSVVGVVGVQNYGTNNYMQFSRANGSISSPLALNQGDQISNIGFSGYDGTQYVVAAGIETIIDGPVNAGSLPTAMLFTTGANGVSERMRITSQGNVGIGTSTPNRTLSVFSNGGLVSSEFFTNTTSSYIDIFDTNSNALRMGSFGGVVGLANGFTTIPNIVIDAFGNVGIGATAPSNKLQVFSSQAAPSTTRNAASAVLSLTGGTGALQRGGYSGLFIADNGGTNNYNERMIGSASEVYAGLLSDANGVSVTPTNWNGTILSAQGLSAGVNNFTTGSGVINEATGILTGAGVASTGIIRNAFGLRISEVEAVGTDPGQAHNAYGIFIDDNVIASGGSTNRAFSIFSSSTANSFFAGNVGIGTTTSQNRLAVVGTGGDVGVLVSNTNGFSNMQLEGSSDTGTYIDFSRPGTDFLGRIIYDNELGQMDFVASTTGVLSLRGNGTAIIGTTGASQIARGTLSLGTDQVTAVERSLHFGWTGADYYGFRLLHEGNPASFGAGKFHIQRGQTTSWLSSFTMDDAGNVGIGTTNPDASLHVFKAGSAGIIKIDSPTVTQLNYALNGIDRYSAEYVAASDFFAIGRSGLAYDLVLNDGNVGIGTSSPVQNLHIHEALGLADIRLSGTAVGADTFELRQGVLGVTNSGFSIYDLESAANRFVIDTNGNVGIGTTSPTARLSLAVASAGSANLLNLTNSINGSSLVVGSVGGLGNFIAGSQVGDTAIRSNNGNLGLGTANGYINFGNSTNEWMRIAVDGNIGVGTTSPAQKLSIQQGNVFISSSDQTLARLQIQNTGASGRQFDLVSGIPNVGQAGFSIFDATANESRFVVSDVGNIGIGDVSPNQRLSVNGTIASYIDGFSIHGGSYLMPSGALANGFAGGTTHNVYFDGTNWIAPGDGVNNGGTAALGTINGAFTLYTIPSTGPSSQTISTSTFNSLARLSIGSDGNVWVGGNILVADSVTPTLSFDSTAGSSGSLSYNSSSQWILDNLNGGTDIIRFQSGGTDRVVFAANGNVGIGTAAPSALLDVYQAGQASFNNGIRIRSDAASDLRLLPNQGSGSYNGITRPGDFVMIYSNITTGASDGDAGLVIAPHFTGTSGIRLDRFGNVGIGVSNPSARLSVSDDTGLPLLVETDQTGQFEFRADGTPNFILNSTDSNFIHFQFQNNGAAQWYISKMQTTENLSFRDAGFGAILDMTQAGNVGIGTTTPLQKLQVFGDIRVGTAGSNGCIEDYSGGVIGGTCSSDERLKDNVEPLASSSSRSYLEGLTALTPVTYTWNETAVERLNKTMNVANLGLIAQDVEREFPELVTRDSNGFRQVDFRALPFYLIEAMKELWAKVQGIDERVQDLERENEYLKNRLDQIEDELNVTPPTTVEPTESGPEESTDAPVSETEPAASEPVEPETAPAAESTPLI